MRAGQSNDCKSREKVAQKPRKSRSLARICAILADMHADACAYSSADNDALRRMVRQGAR